MAAVMKPEQFTVAAEQRYNIYKVVHKGLRGFMADALIRWGKADMTDECERNAAVAQVWGLLDMCAGHLQHENDFIHPAIEAVRKGAAAKTARDHVGHETAIAELRERIARFEAAPNDRLNALGHRLYLDLSAFVAENFDHMIVEETDNLAELIKGYSDTEILAIEQRLVAALKPAEAFADLRWMIGHINTAERAFLLGGMKRGAPPEVFQAALDLARELLTEREFYKLELALQ